VIIIFKKSQYLINIKEMIHNIQNKLLFLFLSGVTVLECMEVFLRYVVKKPLMGIEEILIFPTVWLFFLGSANASLERGQITASVIEMFLKSPKLIKIYKIMVAVFSLIIDCWLTYGAYKYFQHLIRVNKLSGTLYIPLVYGESAVFIGFLLMGIYTAMDIIYYCNKPVHEFKK
jgi:TRAP-type C4-dicarboxylate transport system permease small subunit